MSPDTVCPTVELLRRSLDPDDSIPESERQRIETHVDRCQVGCKQTIEALLRGNTLLTFSAKPPAPPEASTPPPTRLGRYQIVGRIGRGGMGVVWRAHDPQLRRDVAIKVPSFPGCEEACAEARQRFFSESQAAAAVRHVHVCPIYDVGEEGGRPYVVMALVEGQSLAQRLRHGRFEDPTEAVALVVAIADALAAVHAAHIVHRDVKPGNILLDHAGQPFLTDFGLARIEDGERLTANGTLMGTPGYLAPEQVAVTLGAVGPWSDQYSLGVVLYQLLTGRLPFEGTVPALIFQLGTQEAPPPSQFRPGLNPGLEQVLLKALAMKPGARFDSMREFATALRGYSLPSASPSGADNDGFIQRASLPTQEPVRPHPSPERREAESLFLAAGYHLERRTEESHRRSIAIYYQVLDKDPTFAPAWAGLAFAFHLLSVRGYASPTNACPRAKGAALRALTLDSSLSEAHRTLATVRMEFDWDLAGATLGFQRALELNPADASAHQLYGKCLACQGRHSQAIAELHRAVELDPLSAIMSTSLGRHGYLLARQYDQAVRQYQKTLEIEPTFWLVHRFLGWAYLFQGKMTEAVAAFLTAQRLNDDTGTLSGLGYAYAASSQQAKAREILDALTETAKHRYVSPDCQATVCIGLDEKDQAFSWLAKAVEERSEWLCKIRVDPVLDPLRSDPRFASLMQQINVK